MNAYACKWYVRCQVSEFFITSNEKPLMAAACQWWGMRVMAIFTRSRKYEVHKHPGPVLPL
ncbi:hypothetical protein JZ751_020725 [Albula glossodonta]|uniref:Uncharacterized protein n=1 Tax=Albula glossodonta TaxID=121402 RepID=A0A8T2PN18_9TELE|nr:hypothetical protein JZ751_020725 [Albula glossodonta]